MLASDVKHLKKFILLHTKSRIEYLKNVLEQLGKDGQGNYVDVVLRVELKEIFNCLKDF